MQCEGGTALHGAAMCGKDETVQLLLDKGANLELRDSNGHTVFDVLNEFSAEKALSIKKMINGLLEQFLLILSMTSRVNESHIQYCYSVIA